MEGKISSSQMTNQENQYSVSPDGKKYVLPSAEKFQPEFDRLKKLTTTARRDGNEIVVVMGVGFVGAVMAAIVADSTDESGQPSKFVIGCQRPSIRSYWKIPLLNKGVSPVKAEDPEVDKMIDRCVNKKKSLTATYNNDCLQLADCVVVDVQCDYLKQDLGNMRSGEADMAALEATMRTIGEKINPDCLVLIETTVAPGTTEFVAWPILKKAFAKRGIDSEPLLAHSFERVMPGKLLEYITDFPRVIGGGCDKANEDAKFLYGKVVKKELQVTDTLTAELTKCIENTYRDVNIAFANEMALVVEDFNRNIYEIIELINHRHDRMMHFPGSGVGGHCLTKDPHLLVYGHHTYTENKYNSEILLKSRRINDFMPEHMIELLEDARDDPSVSLHKKIQMNFLLGKLYDRKGDYDRAFSRFKAGNELTPRKFDRSVHRESVDAIIAAFSPERVAAYPRSSNSSRKPIRN